MQRKPALVLAATLAACLITAAACSKFEESADPAPDGAANLETGAGDAGGDGGDANADAAATCSPDAAVLVGSFDVAAPKVDDIVSGGSVDAHRFVAATSASASCMHLYVREWPADGTILVGVYDDVGDAPKNLLAQTTLVDPAKTMGWARAPLNKALPIEAGNKLWLAFYAPTDKLVVRSLFDAGCPIHLHNSDIPLGSSALDMQFIFDSTYPACEPAVFLSP